eukprot:TRINITY_DN3998_c3_g1_i1.p1 TRINITY_DN3998_c3_g1~~TRINITY_DN3998_c3_g1_i1.p1  ORF type:complete len:521 (+),score=60.89 TRINITY_DN3998_c3_g1_i1:83-1645(+)
MVGTTCKTPEDLDTRPFQMVPSRHCYDDVAAGHALQEHHIQLQEFIPVDIQGKDRTMYTSAVSQLFRNYAKMVTKSKLIIQNGTVVVRGHCPKKEMMRRLGKACQSKLVSLSERHCYVLMNNKNLMDFTKETGAFGICKPKQELLLILGPAEKLKIALKYIEAHYTTDSSNGETQRSDRRIMKISVLARQYLLDNRQHLVEKGHIWVDRASEVDGMQDLHIVGYPKDFDFDRTEKAIRDAEFEYLETNHGGAQKLPSGVVLLGDKVQIKKHRDSSKLLIAEAAEDDEEPDQIQEQPGPSVKTGSTVDFPYLTNPLKYSTTVFGKTRGDPNNIWASTPLDVSSAVSNSSTMFAYHSSASSSGMPEQDTELPLEMSAPWMNDDEFTTPAPNPPPSTPTRLLHQLSAATVPLSPNERALLQDICQAAGIINKSGRAHVNMIKVLVHYSSPRPSPLRGNHTFLLHPNQPFSVHKEEICGKLGVNLHDHAFEHYDKDFGVHVKASDDHRLQSFSRIQMKQISYKP